MNEIQSLIAIGKEIHQKYDEMMIHMDEVTSYLLFANDIYVACGPDDNDLLDGIFDEKAYFFEGVFRIGVASNA